MKIAHAVSCSSSDSPRGGQGFVGMNATGERR